MRPILLNAARALLLAGLFATLALRNGQAQTPEGTVIRNIASVTFTDANNNTYAAVADTVDVTVGFAAGIDVIAAAATVSPQSPSTADTLYFDVQNIGNGTDSVLVSQSISVPGIITVTGYRVGAVTHANLAALNLALSGTPVALNGTVTIKVVYDVGSNLGGVSTVYTLTAASRRNPAVTDQGSTTITPSETAAVAVTPDGGQNLQRLPSNGTNYTFTFSVTNNGNGPEDFDLLGSHPNVPITIVSVNGVAGASTAITNLAAGASQSIAVIYSIGNVAAGSVDTLYLRASSVSTPAVSDTGFADVTVTRPALVISKTALRDDQTTPIGPGDTVIPGEYIKYKVTVTNSGAATASVVHVDDILPAELTYNAVTGDAAGWTFSGTGNDRDADLTGTLAAGASRFFWIRALVN